MWKYPDKQKRINHKILFIKISEAKLMEVRTVATFGKLATRRCMNIAFGVSPVFCFLIYATVACLFSVCENFLSYALLKCVKFCMHAIL